jgi:hypothetical protein
VSTVFGQQMSSAQNAMYCVEAPSFFIKLVYKIRGMIAIKA